jgi:uncharacterized protein GlcG (DUF336 family)
MSERVLHFRWAQRILAIACLVLAASGCRDGDAPKGESPDTKRPETSGCDQVPVADELRRLLQEAPTLGEAGGLAGGRKMWAALVDRGGRVCGVVTSTEDPTDGWPGSRGIAMAKAYTANAFSTNESALSTERLYTLAQPGHSLFGAAAGNPLDPSCLDVPERGQQLARPRVCGGTIVFGGGLPLYKSGLKVGGLGVSGDTACTDHEIAKRVRDRAALNPPQGALADDIQYAAREGGSAFTHPLCINTWRNGQKIGDEAPAAGY